MQRRALPILVIMLTSTFLLAQTVQVRMNSRLSSESATAGTPFRATLASPVRLDGRTCAQGSAVGGVVTEAKRSGRLSSPGVLVLQPTWVSCGGRRVPVTAEPARLEGGSHTKRNAVLIGGGAAAGGILGAIFGGGKGAAIGAAAGAGAGTVTAAATGRHEAVIEPESMIQWSVQPNHQAPQNSYANSGRPSRESHYAESSEGRRGHHHDDDEDDDRDDRRGYDRDSQQVRFTEHDREYLSQCLVSNYRLPPGLAKQGKIPPGHAKKMPAAGYSPVPGACTAGLSPIPYGWERVVLDARVILLDAARHEVDSFIWRE